MDRSQRPGIGERSETRGGLKTPNPKNGEMQKTLALWKIGSKWPEKSTSQRPSFQKGRACQMDCLRDLRAQVATSTAAHPHPQSDSAAAHPGPPRAPTGLAAPHSAPCGWRFLGSCGN